MLEKYNSYLIKIGNKLRNKFLFDIYEPINHSNFFKIKFFKVQKRNDLILNYIK